MTVLYLAIMYEQFLIQAGLTKDQASIYNILIRSGLITAGAISKKTALKRGLAYKVIGQLISLGLVEKKEEKGVVALFRATHPSNLESLIEKKKAEIRNAEASLTSTIPALISDFNLNSGKPNVQFFEGMEGIMKVADDSLSSTTEIYSFIDNEAVMKNAPEINTEYVKRRRNEKIHKKMIAVDGAFIRDRVHGFDPETTEVRVIAKNFGFSTVMQIYDGKVSYATFESARRVGVIIEDQEIYKMHKTIFEYVWERAEPIFPMPDGQVGVPVGQSALPKKDSQ